MFVFPTRTFLDQRADTNEARRAARASCSSENAQARAGGEAAADRQRRSSGVAASSTGSCTRASAVRDHPRRPTTTPPADTARIRSPVDSAARWSPPTTTSPRSPRCSAARRSADVRRRRARRRTATPVVIRNAPLTRDGTPMPTRYWLVDPQLSACRLPARAAGGVRAAEAAVDPDALRPRTTATRPSATPRSPAATRAASVRRRGRHPQGRQVPARALRRYLSPAATTRSAAGLADATGVSRLDVVTPRTSGGAVTRVAAVDIGTNSTRLLVADVDGPSRDDASCVPLDRRMRITRLGQGVDRTRALASGRDRAHGRRAARVPRRDRRARRRARCARPPRAQRATRRNRDDFFDAAHDALGVRPSSSPATRRRAVVPRRHRRPRSRRRRTSSSTSAAAPPSSSSAPTRRPACVSLDIGLRAASPSSSCDVRPARARGARQAVAIVRDPSPTSPRDVPGATEAATLVGLAGHRHHRRRDRARPAASTTASASTTSA